MKTLDGDTIYLFLVYTHPKKISFHQYCIHKKVENFQAIHIFF